jgi:hypothetical protein
LNKPDGRELFSKKSQWTAMPPLRMASDICYTYVGTCWLRPYVLMTYYKLQNVKKSINRCWNVDCLPIPDSPPTADRCLTQVLGDCQVSKVRIEVRVH